MTKTNEELKQIKQEFEELTCKLKELSEEELNLVTGGVVGVLPPLTDLVPLVGNTENHLLGAGLSGGQQQRVAVVSSFPQRPTILILDEPVSNLD
ncbi:MAG: ATP-binding cassette domain-containing protein [Erysipelotrichaceae bacterium]|nr:ATP-binding cassette domain-containing protein [Erysipelotrichaceae bacterium]